MGRDSRMIRLRPWLWLGGWDEVRLLLEKWFACDGWDVCG
jgi:hypothetical protein